MISLLLTTKKSFSVQLNGIDRMRCCVETKSERTYYEQKDKFFADRPVSEQGNIEKKKKPKKNLVNPTHKTHTRNTQTEIETLSFAVL